MVPGIISDRRATVYVITFQISSESILKSEFTFLDRALARNILINCSSRNPSSSRVSY